MGAEYIGCHGAGRFADVGVGSVPHRSVGRRGGHLSMRKLDRDAIVRKSTELCRQSRGLCRQAAAVMVVYRPLDPSVYQHARALAVLQQFGIRGASDTVEVQREELSETILCPVCGREIMAGQSAVLLQTTPSHLECVYPRSAPPGGWQSDRDRYRQHLCPRSAANPRVESRVRQLRLDLAHRVHRGALPDLHAPAVDLGRHAGHFEAFRLTLEIRLGNVRKALEENRTRSVALIATSTRLIEESYRLVGDTLLPDDLKRGRPAP